MGPGFISFVFILHSLSQQISFVVGWFGCLFFLFLNSNRPMLVQMKKKKMGKETRSAIGCGFGIDKGRQ